MFLFYFHFFRFYSISTCCQGTEEEERARVSSEATAIRQQTFLCFSLGSYLKQGCVLVIKTLKSFHLILDTKPPLYCLVKNIKKKQFILLKHRNMLLGKAIPTTMILCMPKVGFSLKSVVLVVKSKPKLSDFSGELKDKCVKFLFFIADVV